MWIEKLDNGKYKFVERYTNPLTFKDKKVSLTSTKNTAAIRKEMPARLQEKIDKKLRSAPNKSISTFGELADKYEDIYIKSFRETTYGTNKYKFKRIKKELGTVAIENLNAPLVNQFLLELQNTGISYATASQYKGLLRNTLKFGYKHGFLKEEFSHLLEIERINIAVKNDLKFLEPEEFKSAIDQLTELGYEEFARMFYIQAYTGMRIGELLGLDAERIDLKNKTILINRSLKSSAKDFTLTKNGKERTIHINDDVAKVIAKQFQETKIKQLKKNLERKSMLFVNRAGNYLQIRTVNTVLKKVQIEDKILSTHYFRHTCVSLMVQDGIDVHLIARHVGHVNTKMIEEIYYHFTKKMDVQLKNAVDQFKIQ